MTDRDVANVLRGAQHQGVIHDWTPPQPDDTWTIRGQLGADKTYNGNAIRDYCRTLMDAGVQPRTAAQTCTDCGWQVRNPGRDACPRCGAALTT